MVRTVMLAAAMLLTANVQATAEVKGRTIIGPASHSCGTWTMSRRTPLTVDSERVRNWVAGFVSGVNWESTQQDALRDVGFDGVVAWVDNYCQSNPLDTIFVAVVLLVRELREKAKR